MKKFVAIVSIISVIAILCCMPMGFACDHEETYTKITTEPTCTTVGTEMEFCSNCDEMISQKKIPTVEHTFGEYVVTVQPSNGVDGEQTRTCINCDAFETEVYVCPHASVSDGEIVKEATCTEMGIKVATCEDCSTEFEVNIPMIPHKGDWRYSYYATPFADGERTCMCEMCHNDVTELYSIEMDDNSLYIPVLNLYHELDMGEFSIEAVENGDIIYTTNAYEVEDSSNPFIIGNSDSCLAPIYKLNMGTNVYVCMNGQIETYQIFITDEATISDGAIIGKTTNMNMWDVYGSDLPSTKTVFGTEHGGVDKWGDIDDGKTLRLCVAIDEYTCFFAIGTTAR